MADGQGSDAGDCRGDGDEMKCANTSKQHGLPLRRGDRL